MAGWLFTFFGWVVMGFMGLNGYQSKYVETAAGPVHYFEAQGSGSLPPVLLLHGIGSQASDLYLLTEQLRPRFRKVIALDLPAHGYSRVAVDKVPRALAEASYYQAVDAILAQEEPVLLFGNSFGGWMAISYALHKPAELHSLVLVSPAGAELEPSEFERVHRIFAHDTTEAPGRVIPLFFNQPPYWAGVAEVYIHTRFSSPGLQAMVSQFTPESHLTPDEAARLHALKLPVMLIWGQQDRIFPRQLPWFRQHLPAHARIEQPAHFTHNPYVEANMQSELAEMMAGWARAPQ